MTKRVGITRPKLGFFLHILTSKGGNIIIAFPLPSPPCNVVPMFELPGGVQILLFFEVTEFEYNVSTILLPIVG